SPPRQGPRRGSCETHATPGTRSERYAKLNLVRSRRDEVGPAECRKEVVQRFLVRQVDDAHAHTELGLLSVQDVVDADAQIEEMSWRDPRRVCHIVRRTLGGDPEACCTEVRRRATRAGERDVASGSLATAEESDRRLLI